MAFKNRTHRLIIVIAGLAILILYKSHQLSTSNHQWAFSATLLINFSDWKVQLAFPDRRTLAHPFPTVATKINVKKGERRKNVLIVAQGRSGSSFLGQLFNQHSDVLYLYEPLYSLEQIEKVDSFRGNSTQRYDKLGTMYLRELMDCSFGNGEYLELMSRLGHFRFSSRVLTSPPFCHRDAKNAKPRDIISKGLCDSLRKDEMERICRKRKLTVVKLLSHRIPHKSIEYLVKNLSSHNYDLIIIHLVRDPRAVIHSMWKYGWISYASNGNLYAYSSTDRPFHWLVQRICNQTMFNLYPDIDSLSRTNVKYKLLRYEDFVQQPQRVAKTLYNLTGLAMPPEIENWVNEVTHPEDTDDIDDPYSIRKNPHLVASSWKKRLDNYTVNVVDKYCSPMMKMLGYQ